MRYKKLIRSLYDQYKMKSLLKEQEPQEVKKNVFNERKKVFYECLIKLFLSIVECGFWYHVASFFFYIKPVSLKVHELSKKVYSML